MIQIHRPENTDHRQHSTNTWYLQLTQIYEKKKALKIRDLYLKKQLNFADNGDGLRKESERKMKMEVDLPKQAVLVLLIEVSRAQMERKKMEMVR